jgi:hypothetical protein
VQLPDSAIELQRTNVPALVQFVLMPDGSTRNMLVLPFVLTPERSTYSL